MTLSKLSTSLVLILLLQCLATASPIPPSLSLRAVPGNARSLGDNKPGSLLAVRQSVSHGKEGNDNNLPPPEPPSGPGGNGRRTVADLQDLLHIDRRDPSARAQEGWGNANPPHSGDLPHVDLPPFPDPPPARKGGDHGRKRPNEGTSTTTPVPTKGVPRRKGGYSGPGGHGRRSLKAVRKLLYNARRSLVDRRQAWEGSGPVHGNLPPVNLPPVPDPARSHNGGNYGGKGPHEGNTVVTSPSKGVPRRKGGYFGPGHGS